MELTLKLTRAEANAIQVALDHMTDMHADIFANAYDRETREFAADVCNTCERILTKIEAL